MNKHRSQNELSFMNICDIDLVGLFWQAGGPTYKVELGRRDGLISMASRVEGNIPPPTFDLDQLNTLFFSKGLSQIDMIALSGKFEINIVLSGRSEIQ